jgi:hypothetical protein
MVLLTPAVAVVVHIAVELQDLEVLEVAALVALIQAMVVQAEHQTQVAVVAERRKLQTLVTAALEL